jgi:hypothetical protein
MTGLSGESPELLPRPEDTRSRRLSYRPWRRCSPPQYRFRPTSARPERNCRSGQSDTGGCRELRELTGIPLAVSAGDEDELSECINKLRAGPIFG